MAVALLALAPHSLAGQSVFTKSGTPVVAHPRTPGCFPQPKEAPANHDPGTLIVLSPPEWYNTLLPYLQWKRQQGFSVEWIPAEVRQRDTLRHRLLQRYLSDNPLCQSQNYLLLVGDVDRIQSFVGQHTPAGLNNHATDLYYGEYTGDYLPEALVGRLSVADSQQLQVLLNKLIAYEKGLLWHDADADGKVLLVAGNENTPPAPTTTNGQVNYLRALAASRHPSLYAHCLYNTDTTDYDSLPHLLQQHFSLVSYTGHGLRSGWQYPPLTGFMLDTLQGLSPNVWVNNCCLSNAYDGLCFGEQLLRNPDGPVGVIGASNETLWNEDFYWAVGAKYPPTLSPDREGEPGAFDALLSDVDIPSRLDLPTLGHMLYNGCRAVTLAGSLFDAFYWETYCLLGDPTMIPFLSAPDSLWMTIPFDTLLAGTTLLELSASPFARISVTADTLLLGTALADSTGHAVIPLLLPLTHDTVCLTATRPQGKACLLQLPVANPLHGLPAVCRWRQSGDTLHLLLRNVGSQRAEGFSLVVAAQGEADTTQLPAMEADDTLTLSLALRHRWLRASASAAILSLCDSTGVSHDISLILSPLCPSPEVTSLAVLDSNAVQVRQLAPGQDYLLALTLSADVDTLVAWVNGEDTPVIQQATQYLVPFRLSGDCRASISVTLHSDCGDTTECWWFQGFRATETFESASFQAYPWQQSPSRPWHIDSLSAQGRYSACSPELPDAMRSMLSLPVDVIQDDSISFWYNVSSEASDWLNFYIDGRRRGYWSGNTGWKRFALPLTQGKHLLQWEYAKDASQSQRDDCARIDNVSLPLCRWSQPYGDPVADSILCHIPHAPSSIGDTPRSVYPNPTTGHLTVDAPPHAGIILYNSLGREVLRTTSNTQSPTLDLSFLPAGLYWLVMRGEGNTLLHQKVIIVK